MRTRSSVKQDDACAVSSSLPPEIWNNIIGLLNPLGIRNLSLTCRYLHEHCHNTQLQVTWLKKYRPGKELLAACKVGMGCSTIQALLQQPSLYDTYKADAKADWHPTLLANAAYCGSVAVVTLLLEAGESIHERAGQSSVGLCAPERRTHNNYYLVS